MSYMGEEHQRRMRELDENVSRLWNAININADIVGGVTDHNYLSNRGTTGHSSLDTLYNYFNLGTPASGDLLYWTNSRIDTLAVGTASYLLVAGASSPYWGIPVWAGSAYSQAHARSHQMTSSLDHTAGAWKIFYSNAGGAIIEVSLGTASYLLTGNSASAAPTWGIPVWAASAYSVAFIAASTGSVALVAAYNAGSTASVHIADVSTYHGFNTASLVQGDILYYNGSKILPLHPGVASYILTISASATGSPYWKEGHDFVDRGDPAAYDLEIGAMTTDGGWHDWDISGVVPAGAKAVLLNITLQDDAVGSTLYIRKNGNANAYNVAKIRTQVANAVFSADVVVIVDTNRVVEYNATNTTWTGISSIIKGWWI